MSLAGDADLHSPALVRHLAHSPSHIVLVCIDGGDRGVPCEAFAAGDRSEAFARGTPSSCPWAINHENEFTSIPIGVF